MRHTFLILGSLLATAWCLAAIDQAPENGDLEKRRAFYEPQNRALKFQTSEEAFPRRVVHASATVWKLEKATISNPPLSYVWKGVTNGIEDFNEHTQTSALLILKDNKVVTEIYRAGSRPETRFVSFSVAKSITSMLIGLALEDGLIKSVDDPLTRYLPALIGSAYEGVTVEDALQMLSGIAFDDTDSYVDSKDQSNPLIKALKESVVAQRYRFVEAANALRRERPIGSKFIYNTMNTCLLGWVIESAARQRVATYMQERLWRPAGMESDAAWLLDGPPDIGREMVAGRFVATLKDYGRLGLLMVNGGAGNGRQLISSKWVKVSTTPGKPAIQFGKLSPDYPLGYGYSWWLFPNGCFEAQGIFGQFIYIAPEANVVIVKFSHWTEAWQDDKEEECSAFFEAVKSSLK